MKTIDLKLAQRVAMVVAVTIMVACSWLAPLESAANQQVDAGLKRALISFGTARALNAAISVVQGTEIVAQPAGLGITLSVGQVLRPVNDVVEQFAHLMLVASVAFGIEKILMSIGSHWLISLLLTAAAIGWAYLYLRHHLSPAWLTRILVILLMTRFAMPVVIIGSDRMFHQFMADEYTSSQRVIEASTGQLNTLSATTAPNIENQGIWDKVKGWVSQNADIKARLANLKQAAEQTTERIIKLMVIFVLQTLLIPLFLLWVLWGVAKGTFEMPARVS